MFSFLSKGSTQRRTLVFASATHVWSDLFYALLIPLLPLMQADPDLGLSYAQVGLLRSVYSGALAALQIPAGILAETLGEFWLLIGGNIWVAAGLVGMALAPSYLFLLAITVVSGFGGGTQHPLATSMVSRAYDERGRSTAIGIVNFSGDLGKMVAPVLALLIALRNGWRATLRVAGLGGIAFMAASMFARRGVDSGVPAAKVADSERERPRRVHMRGFLALSGVGFLDSGTRSAALTFLPFIMKDKGMSDEQTLTLLIFLLAGGAAGKFICGWLDDRYGSIRLIWGTKGLTAVLLLAALATPPLAMVPLMVVLGIGLNGTSSVLYSTVSAFVPTSRRARIYGYYYTVTEMGGTLAPAIYGSVADLFKLRTAMIAMSLVTSLILPASLALRKPMADQERAAGDSSPKAE